MSELDVLSVASEIYPLVKTGGLADVVGALPRALAREGIAMRSLVPGYPAVMDALRQGEVVHSFAGLHGGPARLVAARAAGLDLLALDAPHLYARPGNPYHGAEGEDWPDNALRFAALAEAAATLARGEVAAYTPDVVHGHDWQAALFPALLHYGGAKTRAGTVLTVHNLAFQGQFPAGLLAEIGLPPQAYAIDGVEYHGTIGYLKAGLVFADRITTVSPTYANEILTPESGMGLDGVLRHRKGVLSGIVNGIDDDVWNPATDTLLPRRYDATSVADRASNKEALQRRFGLDVAPSALVFGAISRLAWQKGMDVLLEVLPVLVESGAQLALLGSGDALLARSFEAAAWRHRGRVAATIGYDEALAHLVQGGADAFLVPSRFEPCGLTQLCALRYGAIPVVSRVGGLADTVVDATDSALAQGSGTGVQFAPVARDAFGAAIRRTLALHGDADAWRRIQQRAMTADVGWTHPARRYAALYRELAASRTA